MGTIILLAGVLALSWRLNNEPAAQSPVAQSALAPGLGFVDNIGEEGEDDAGELTDEEGVINTDRQSLLGSGPPLTPTTKYDTVLSVTRGVRRRGMTEADEIWGELEDSTTIFPSPLSLSRRRSSVGTLPSMATRRDTEEGLGERSGLLRSSSGWSRRDRRRRSSHFPGFGTLSSPKTSRHRPSRSQDAVGGWWKMKWWKRRKERDGYGGDNGGESSSQHPNIGGE